MIDILVCDDSAEIVEQVKKLLCAWEKVNTVSFNIDCRQSGKFILENKHKYDIAFIDIEMSMGYKKDIFAVFAYEFEPSP